MPQPIASDLAAAILGAHLIVVGFNLFGLVAIPLGAWFGWAFVRILWWRALHLASLLVVAVQALAGRACFLTLWQGDVAGSRPTPMIMGWINSLLYWPLPLWVFTLAYVAVFAYTLALFWIVPPRRSRR